MREGGEQIRPACLPACVSAFIHSVVCLSMDRLGVLMLDDQTALSRLPDLHQQGYNFILLGHTQVNALTQQIHPVSTIAAAVKFSDDGSIQIGDKQFSSPGVGIYASGRVDLDRVLATTGRPSAYIEREDHFHSSYHHQSGRRRRVGDVDITTSTSGELRVSNEGWCGRYCRPRGSLFILGAGTDSEGTQRLTGVLPYQHVRVMPDWGIAGGNATQAYPYSSYSQGGLTSFGFWGPTWHYDETASVMD